MSDRAVLNQYIETLQILAHEGEADRTDAERERDAVHRAKLIDGFAHELAERQRKAIEGFDLDDHWAVYYRVSDVESLPDLIDPSAGPVRPDEEATT